MILPKSHEDDNFEEPPAELHLHLRMPQGEKDKQPPSKLARWLGLHLYSEVLLSTRARIEMNFAAVVLIIVTLFEFVAWSFLFNSIFNSDILYHGIWMLPAMLMASLFASAVFWFERQFLTYDEALRDKAKRAAWIRLTFILAAAFITAQPLELLFFRVPIHARVHEERIREEAVNRLNALLKHLTLTKEGYTSKTGRRDQLFKDLNSQIGDAEKTQASLETDLRSKTGELASLKVQLDSLRREKGNYTLTPEARYRVERETQRVEARRAAVTSDVHQLESQIGQAKLTIGRLQTQANLTQVQLDQIDDVQQQKKAVWDQRLRDWIERLQASSPGESVPEDARWSAGTGDFSKSAGTSPWTGSLGPYKDRDYDFFEQIHLVWDLAFGRAPRWKTATPEIRQQLEAGYGFSSLGQEEKGWQPHLFIAIFACHLIALFIPLLVLTIKTFLMPQELRNYYSSRYQAAAGDMDAWFSTIVAEKVREEDRLATRTEATR